MIEPRQDTTLSAGRLVVIPCDFRQLYFALAWPAPAYARANKYAWHILSALFGDGTTSEPVRKLREEKGLAYHVGSSYQAYAGVGALFVEGVTMPDTLIPTVTAILLELKYLGSRDIDPDRYHHTVQSLISRHLASSDSAYACMSHLGLQEPNSCDSVSSEEVVKRLRAQPPEAVREQARQLIQNRQMTIALVGPVDKVLLAQVENVVCDFGR